MAHRALGWASCWQDCYNRVEKCSFIFRLGFGWVHSIVPVVHLVSSVLKFRDLSNFGMILQISLVHQASADLQESQDLGFKYFASLLSLKWVLY